MKPASESAEAHSNLEDLVTLYNLSQRVSQARSGTEVMRAALEELAEHSPYRCTIALLQFDPAGQPLQFHVPFFYQPGVGVQPTNDFVPTGEDELNPLLDAGQTVAIADVGADPRVPEVLRREQLSEGRPALAIIPLVVGGRRTGNLILSHTEPHAWTESELRLFRSSANQLAVAIDNAQLFADTQRALDETRLLYETSRRLSTALDVDEVIEVYLDQVAARGPYTCSLVLYEFDAAGHRTAVIAHAHWTPNSGLFRVREYYPNERDDLDPVIDAGQIVLISDVHTDPRVSATLRQIQAVADRPALAMIPLMVHGQCIGLVVLSSPQVHRWAEADLWPYQVTASPLATAIDNRRQQVLLYERGQQLAVLEERQRLARDLHDTVTQLIFSLTLIAQSVGTVYRRDQAEGERRLGRVVELSQQALAEMRALLAELRPVTLVPEGLLPALKQQIEWITSQEKFFIQLVADGYTPRSSEVEEALFRIAQESLNNIVKHAHAGQVVVRLSQANGRVELSVTDDGRGFDPALSVTANRDGGGLGLIGMRERVEQLAGALEIRSIPGKGTIIRASLPARQ